MSMLEGWMICIILNALFKVMNDVLDYMTTELKYLQILLHHAKFWRLKNNGKIIWKIHDG